jgi:hypothetical protein
LIAQSHLSDVPGAPSSPVGRVTRPIMNIGNVISLDLYVYLFQLLQRVQQGKWL